MKTGAPAPALRLFTIGYEGKDIPSFIGSLRSTDVAVVVDVRELPLSRKRGFSKTALRHALSAEGIDYIPLRGLGAPREVRHRLREDGDYPAYFAAYLRHLGSQAQALSTVTSLLSETSVCLMCYEADHAQCHRSMIALELRRQKGHVLEVTHL